MGVAPRSAFSGDSGRFEWLTLMFLERHSRPNGLLLIRCGHVEHDRERSNVIRFHVAIDQEASAALRVRVLSVTRR